MSAFLESLLKGANPGTITEIFFWLIVVSLLIALWCRKKGKSPAYVNYSATLLTSLGILGTFIGIVVGLLDFNAEDIDGSIAMLLAGLKTAFITSLVGMLASILYKVSGAISFFVKTEGALLEEVGAEDIYLAIKEQGNSMLKSAEVQQTLLMDLKQAIVGSGDDTLVSQVKLLRTDINDNYKQQFKVVQVVEDRLKAIQIVTTEQQQTFQQFSDTLWIKLQDVADMISKSATEQVINALKEVITDFNNNLIEQFGDNFKALDESVKKLVTWQENYSLQIEQMVEQYKQGVTAIDQTAVSVANISEKSAHIPETMNNLKEVMEVNQHQVKELERHLEAFKLMRDKAVEAVPEIRKQVEETVNEITKSVNIANEHYTTLLTESDKYIKQHVDTSNELLDKFVTNTKEGMEAVKTGLIEGSELIGKDLKSGSEEVKKAIEEGAGNFVKATEEGAGNFVKATEETVNEITKSVNIANEHYTTLLTESDKYIKQHVDTSNELLDKFVTNTKEGMEAVKTGLIEGSELIGKDLKSGSEEVKKAIEDGAENFVKATLGSNDSLTKTANELEKQSGIITKQLDDTVADINANVREMIIKIVEESKAIGDSLKDSNQQLNTNIKQVQDQVADNVDKMQNRLESALNEVFQVQAKEIKRTFDALEDEVKSTVGLTGEAVNKQLTMIDKSMEQEVEKVMRTMGTALAMISGQFTNDYEQLVNAMAEIVNQQGHR